VILAGFPSGASNGEPHILQNFMPGAFKVPHELHATEAISEVLFFFFRGSGEGCWASVLGIDESVSGVPHERQKRDPSLLSFPQLEHKGMVVPLTKKRAASGHDGPKHSFTKRET
jgi:hypothetical protein